MAADLTFLFWNTAGRPVGNIVASLARTHAVDVLVLAECASPEKVLSAANENTKVPFQWPVGRLSRLTVLTRFPRRFLGPLYEEERISIRRLRLPARTEMLLVLVHLRSKLHRAEGSQIFEASRLARLIERQEEREKHSRTLVVGDFNMNPFEPGIVAAGGLHAVASRRIASEGARTVQGQTHRYFYNPMWNFLGDARESPPGTYYRRRGDHVEYFWHAFDQVLVRPDLLDGFTAGKVRILTGVPEGGTNSFLTKAGFPNRQTASDHLPLLFKVAL